MARLEVSVRPATAADVRPLAAVMGRAFEDDPPFVWMLPDARTRQARAGRFFGTVMRTEALAYGAVEVASLGGVIVGGTIWYPPGRWAPGVQLRTLLGFARAFGQAGEPAYLESSKLANVPLYQHFGFEPTEPTTMPDGAPVITPMWRVPTMPSRG
jgi:hypothetical protein